MKLTRTALLTLALVPVLVFAACSSDDNPVIPEEPEPPPRITETFMGEFGMDGRSEHSFTVEAAGNVEMTITALAPVATLTVGMGIGNFDATADPTCSLIASDDRVVLGTTLLSAVGAVGEYCVQVGDVGNVFPDATVTYTVDVLHP